MTQGAGGRRVVFDCNIYVQAIAFDTGPAAAAFRLAEAGAFELFISRATVAELRRVLTYSQVLRISPNLTPLRIAAFLERLNFRATLQRRVRHVFQFKRDPKDEPYLDLAAAVRAHYLVSRDRDLLSLMTGHTALCKQFRQKTRPLQIVNPVAFIQAIDPNRS